MKQKKYFNLVDKNGYAIFQAEVEYDDYHMNVGLYRVSSWEYETKKAS